MLLNVYGIVRLCVMYTIENAVAVPVEVNVRVVERITRRYELNSYLDYHEY